MAVAVDPTNIETPPKALVSEKFEDDAPGDVTTIVQPLGEGHTHTIIFLHGREDFGSDLAQYFFDSKSSCGKSLAELFPTAKFVLPTAKLRYSAQRDAEFSTSSFAEALKGEEIISQWFDLWDIKTPEFKQELMIPGHGLRESIHQILDIIREEAKLVPLGQVVLGGISQGCATAIHALLASGMKIGGFIGLCSFLPFQKDIEAFSSKSTQGSGEIASRIQGILGGLKESQGLASDDLEASIGTLSLHEKSKSKSPVFLAHSQDDETVPFGHGEGLRKTIENLDFEVTWKEYEDGGHWIHSGHGVDDLAAFLDGVFKSERNK